MAGVSGISGENGGIYPRVDGDTFKITDKVDYSDVGTLLKYRANAEKLGRNQINLSDGMDTNGNEVNPDGQLNITEYSAMSAAGSEEEVTNSFNRMDIDKNGNIDEKEMAAFQQYTDSYGHNGSVDGQYTTSELAQVKKNFTTSNKEQQKNIDTDMKRIFSGLYSDTAKKRGIYTE